METIFGKEYYIDIDEISERCKYIQPPEREVVLETEDGDEFVNDTTDSINIFKYETIKMCIQRVLSEEEETDEMMGSLSQKSQSISFKLAFNTLVQNKIIKQRNE